MKRWKTLIKIYLHFQYIGLPTHFLYIYLEIYYFYFQRSTIFLHLNYFTRLPVIVSFFLIKLSQAFAKILQNVRVKREEKRVNRGNFSTFESSLILLLGRWTWRRWKSHMPHVKHTCGFRSIWGWQKKHTAIGENFRLLNPRIRSNKILSEWKFYSNFSNHVKG